MQYWQARFKSSRLAMPKSSSSTKGAWSWTGHRSFLNVCNLLAESHESPDSKHPHSDRKNVIPTLQLGKLKHKEIQQNYSAGFI